MSEMRILIVEDNEKDLRSFSNSVKVYKDKKQQTIDTVECKTLKDALEKLDNSFDGAIIDLKLADEGNEGNKVVEKIVESFFRIPIVIFTGDRSNWDENLRKEIMLIGIFTKGAIGYDKLLDKFWEIYNTGLTHIMSGRGIIETSLSDVFLKNLNPNIQRWIHYAKDGEENSERTQNALLRYTLNHLLQLIEEDGEDCFTEEVYLYPPIPDKITTGSMVKEDNQWFVVLSPACDLVIRNGQINTERILFVAVEKEADIVDKACNRLKKITNDEKREEEKNDILQKLSGNNRAFYYHWLPPVKFNISKGGHLDFEGGFLNFRKLEALPLKKFKTRFKDPSIQISPFFVKDIVSRFSSYYARQGQPDIDNKDFIDHYTS